MPLFKIITPSDRTENKIEVTRWVVKGDVCEQTWSQLIDRLQRLFKTRSKQFFVSWFDGTDYCTVRDFTDLEEALEYFSESDSNDKAIRVYASPDKREHHTIFGLKPVEEDEVPTPEENAIKEESEQDIEEEANPEQPNEDSADNLHVVAGDALNLNSPSENECSPRASADIVESTPLEPTQQAISQTPSQLFVQSTLQQPAVSAPAIPPYQNVQFNPYLQYAGQYPYAFYYPTGPQNSLYPMMVPQAPATPAYSAQTTPPQAPLLPTASAPPMSENRPSVQFDSNESDNEMLEALRKYADAPTTNPPMTRKSSVKPPPPPLPPPIPAQPRPQAIQPKGQASGEKRNVYVHVAIQTLRAMGYEQDEKELKRVVRSCKGNLNDIIDKLNASASRK